MGWVPGNGGRTSTGGGLEVEFSGNGEIKIFCNRKILKRWDHFGRYGNGSARHGKREV